MNNHPKKERELVLIKPDGVQRGLIGEIIKRFERVGLKIVGLKITIPTQKQIEAQYGGGKEEITALGKRSLDAQKKKYGRIIDATPFEQGKMIIEKLRNFISSGPIVAVVLEGNQAIAVVDKLVGFTEPLSSDIGTIRGDYTIDSYFIADNDGRAVRNIVHRSGNNEEAEKEIQIWFNKKELLDYRLVNEQILYDVNLDGILE